MSTEYGDESGKFEQEQEFFNSSSSFNGSSEHESSSSEEKVFIKVPVYVPLAYFSLLMLIFLVFTGVYRKRKVTQKISHITSLFDENYPKELYLELKELDEPKANNKVLKAALIRRGSEVFKKMLKLKEIEPYITVLYQKGSIGDGCYDSYKTEKKLNELELNELAVEAEGLKKGWAQLFFGICQEVTMNEALRRRLDAIEERKGDILKEWGILASEIEQKLLVENTKKAK